VLVHRFVWEHINGPIPDGLNVLQSCDNPPCSRPSHLFLGTHTDNMRAMIAKERDGGSWGINRRKTECVNGHPFDAKEHAL
jgi:HNH endonuclease